MFWKVHYRQPLIFVVSIRRTATELKELAGCAASSRGDRRNSGVLVDFAALVTVQSEYSFLLWHPFVHTQSIAPATSQLLPFISQSQILAFQKKMSHEKTYCCFSIT